MGCPVLAVCVIEVRNIPLIRAGDPEATAPYLDSTQLCVQRFRTAGRDVDVFHNGFRPRGSRPHAIAGGNDFSVLHRDGLRTAGEDRTITGSGVGQRISVQVDGHISTGTYTTSIPIGKIANELVGRARSGIKARGIEDVSVRVGDLNGVFGPIGLRNHLPRCRARLDEAVVVREVGLINGNGGIGAALDELFHTVVLVLDDLLDRAVERTTRDLDRHVLGLILLRVVNAQRGIGLVAQRTARDLNVDFVRRRVLRDRKRRALGGGPVAVGHTGILLGSGLHGTAAHRQFTGAQLDTGVLADQRTAGNGILRIARRVERGI